ncbi:hypothetical protein TI03_02885, partial [Achromatium sp. WMS1]
IDIPFSTEQKKMLMGMVERGSIHSIIKYLEKISTSKNCPNQVGTLLELAQNFKLNDIRRILET